MNYKRKLKIKTQLSKKQYRQVAREFYDDIKEMMINHYINENIITKEECEKYTLLKCIQIMPTVKPNERACYLILKEIFSNESISEKERIWMLLKNYKDITKVFEN